MLNNYLKIAARNLQKNKLYTLVNIAGLSIGMTSCILIGLYVFQELSYDRFNQNSDRIVRITTEYSSGGTVGRHAYTGTKAGPQLTRTFPLIEAFTRTFKFPRVVTYGDKMFDEANFYCADSSFFKIFSFKLLAGDPQSVLRRPNDLVITRSMAKKYFGNQNPIGKMVQINNYGNFMVTGLAEDAPDNSQMHFDFIASFSTLDASKEEEWWTANYVTYLLLRRPGQTQAFQRQLSAYMQSKQVRTEAEIKGSDYLTLNLELLKRVHLYSSLNGFEPNGNITYIYILSVIAGLILIVACVNYTNMATAQSASRGGEIAIRKVLGAKPGQLFLQHLGESALLSLIGLMLAILSSIELLPTFNQIVDKSFVASDLFHPLPILSLVLLGLLVSLLSGSYPAMILSRSKLQKILKSGFSPTSSGASIRNGLIVLQFVVSVFLIVSTIVIMQQIHYIQNKNLGYEKDHVIVLPVDYRMHKDYDAIKKVISLNPQILSVAGAHESPTFVQWGDGLHIDKGSEQKDMPITCIPADLDFVKTMNMKLVAGTDFSMADMYSMDTSNDYKNYKYTFILNESAVRAIGWTPTEAIGKTIIKYRPGIVKGVVRDFHFSSLHDPIGPLAIFLDTQWISRLFLRVSGKNIASTISYLKSVWKERVPYRPFEYHFLDDDYKALYKVEARTAKIFTVFSITAVILACLGLFALVAYHVARRAREIGIRKVLGASVLSITALLSKEFFGLVVLACLIAFPLAWWASHQWLQNFAYRIILQWWVFPVAAAITIVIALVTVSVQAIKAGLANPASTLRTE